MLREHARVDKDPRGYCKGRILPKNFDRCMNDHSTSRRRLPVLFAGLLGLVLGAVAQRPAHFEHRNSDLVHALELFDKAKFGPAQYELERVVDRISDVHDPNRTEAEFYSALCAVRLFHDDAGYRLHAFMQEHPEDLHVGVVKLELFKYAFAQKKWKESLYWSDQVDRFALGPADQEEFRFKRGYACLLYTSPSPRD